MPDYSRLRSADEICAQIIRDLTSGRFNTPTPYVAPPTEPDPDSELRAEVAALLACRGVLPNQIALRTAGERLHVEAKRLGLL